MWVKTEDSDGEKEFFCPAGTLSGESLEKDLATPYRYQEISAKELDNAYVHPISPVGKPWRQPVSPRDKEEGNRNIGLAQEKQWSLLGNK